jgi:hypothetical protein
VDGILVSSKYERENGNSKKAKAAKVTIFWSVRANSVRRLSRAEAKAPVAAPEPRSGFGIGRSAVLTAMQKGPPAQAGGPFFFVLHPSQKKQI